MKWLRKWWRAYLQAVREEIAASKQRKRRPWTQIEHHRMRINPATGLPMVGLVDAGGNPYGSNLDPYPEQHFCDVPNATDMAGSSFSSENIGSPYHGATNHDDAFRSSNWE